MIFPWWDDAVRVARLIAALTGHRRKVTQSPGGRGWTVVLADTERPALQEVCS